MKRIQMGVRRPAGSSGTPDPTRHVFTCMICPWQVQAGYAARRDLGVQGLFEGIAFAHLEHVKAEHPTDRSVELEWADGKTHQTSSPTQSALGALPLPRWWVDR